MMSEPAINLYLIIGFTQKKPKVQQDLLLRLIIESLPLIGATLPDDLEKLIQFSKNPQATERFLEFSLDYLLLPYR